MPKKKKTKKQLTPLQRKLRSMRSSLHKYGISIPSEKLREMLSEPLTCPYCKERIAVGEASIDHIMPRSRGGADSPENVQITCLSCNRVKDNLLDEEFRELMNFLLPRLEMYKNLRRRLKAGGFVFGRCGK